MEIVLGCIEETKVEWHQCQLTQRPANVYFADGRDLLIKGSGFNIGLRIWSKQPVKICLRNFLTGSVLAAQQGLPSRLKYCEQINFFCLKQSGENCLKTCKAFFVPSPHPLQSARISSQCSHNLWQDFNHQVLSVNFMLSLGWANPNQKSSFLNSPIESVLSCSELL